MNKWISIDDSAKSKNLLNWNKYIIYGVYTNELKEQIEFIDCAIWFEGTFNHHELDERHIITHWMPLPEPPKTK